MELLINELRIGNYFQHGETLVEVSIIYRTHFYCESIDRICHGNSLQENFQPISLTEEWLFKTGFLVDVPSPIYWYKGDFKFIHDNGGFLIIFKGLKLHYIQYVHQLQNLYFELTGEGLVIKE